MYDIKELEKEWQRYQHKKRRPWYILLVIVVLIVLFMFLFKEKSWTTWIPSDVYHKNKNVKQTDTVYLSPSITELLDKETVSSLDNPLESVSKGMPDENSKTKHSKLHIEVIDVGINKAYKEVEKRFRLSHDVDDSLFLAKAYFDKGEYKKAEYWALQTNKVNDRIEESWLIFVKAKLKQGQKNEAIRILNAYIDKMDSAEAKVLLKKIKEGKM